jgi:small subunit ribosomal protein S4
MFLKGDRCYSDKCAFERRAYAPGQHGQNRFRKMSDYAIQLREKQKVKNMYGMLEKQFRRYYEKADQAKGVTGHNLLVMLESRLDNVLFRAGFAGSRNQARQLARHNHFTLNGRKVNIPSLQIKVGDVIGLKEKSKKNVMITENLEAAVRRGIPPWMELDKEKMQATIKAMPQRVDITMPIQEQLIVELYSK